MVEYAPCIRALVGGERISCVASMVTFDGSTVNHLMSTVIGKELFSFSGLVPQGRLTYSLLNVRVARPMPRPLLVADEDSYILHHDACSWESVREVIELCAGYGGLGQGLLSSPSFPLWLRCGKSAQDRPRSAQENHVSLTQLWETAEVVWIQGH